MQEYDFVAIENLNVADLLKNHKLAKSISDASFSLSYKAAWYEKEVVEVDRWFASSKTCSCCGWVDENLTLADRVFHCKACGLMLDCDLNASRNILQKALRIKEKTVGVNTAQRTLSKCQTKIV